MSKLTEAQRVDLLDKKIAKELEKMKKELINKNKIHKQARRTRKDDMEASRNHAEGPNPILEGRQ